MRTRTARIAAGIGFGAVLITASALGVVRPGSDHDPATSAPAALIQPAALSTAPGQDLEAVIADLEAEVARTPGNYVAWATIGLAYVQQAHVTGDGDLYDRAEVALATSLEIDDSANFQAYAGRSALSAAAHDFGPAREWARKGLEINPYSATLYGALSDAELQLGNYDAAVDAVQRMIDLSPDTSSLARASYTRELRGDIAEATRLMQRALDDAPTAADRAFALLHLGDLAYNAGDATTALEHYRSTRSVKPDSAAALAGIARAEAALGQTEAALAHYEELVGLGREPFYLLRYGELLDSLGRDDEAAVEYERYAEQEAVHAAREVIPDASFTLFLADHGQAEAALTQARRAVETAPFVESQDAYAWALHRNGRHADAWEAMEDALVLGTPNALFHYHAGMIRRALGDDQGAQDHLTRALDINPHFNVVAADVAEQTLRELRG
jgi:tetratricopeptide (TPR) repeat protein